MPQLQQYRITNNDQQHNTDSSLVLLQNQTVKTYWDYNPLSLTTTANTDANLPALPFIEKPINSTFPLFYIYLGIVIFWSVFYRNNFKTIENIARSFISNNAFGQLMNERRSFNGFVSVAMFILGLIVISIFSFLSIQVKYPDIIESNFNNSKIFILIAFSTLITGIFFKSLIIWLSSLIFTQPSTFTGYLSLNINSTQILGILLLPLSILFTFSHQLNTLWIVGFGTFLIVLVFIYRMLRTFFLAVKETNSQVFHIILYICALEILPLFVVGKLLMG